MDNKLELLINNDRSEYINGFMKRKLLEISKDNNLRQRFIKYVSPFLFHLQEEKLDILFSGFHRPAEEGLCEPFIEELIQRLADNQEKFGGTLSYVISKTLIPKEDIELRENDWCLFCDDLKSKLVTITLDANLREKFVKIIAPYLFHLKEEKLDILYSLLVNSQEVQESVINELMNRAAVYRKLGQILNITLAITLSN